MEAGQHRKYIWVAIAVCVVGGLFVFRSRLLGTQATPGDYFPEGYAGEYLINPSDQNGQRSKSILGVRDDGTSIYPADPITFEDADGTRIQLDRPPVSVKEAGRLGYTSQLDAATSVITYGMRGPLSAGFTDLDGQWVVELVERHEDPQVRAKGVTLIAFAITSQFEHHAHHFSEETQREMVDAFERALGSPDIEVQRAAVAMSDWEEWAKMSGTFVESLRSVAESGNTNFERAAYALTHVFKQNDGGLP